MGLVEGVGERAGAELGTAGQDRAAGLGGAMRGGYCPIVVKSEPAICFVLL